jgi:glucose-6-phosphate isomerase
MKAVSLITDHCLISDSELHTTMQQIREEITRMKQACTIGYQDERASLNLPNDENMLEQVKQIVEEKKELHARYLIVVGIGGSNLGTIAVHEALHGRTYNEHDPPLKVLFADTVDPDLIDSIIRLITPVLKAGENIIINAVSKSGGTTETIANFEVLIDVLQRYRPDYAQYIVVTTDQGSPFWNLAKKKDFSILEIPKNVGGRYSVFSAVGLFPLGMLNVDLDALLHGARFMRDQCFQPNYEGNPAALSASLIYLHHTKGINIHDLFLFSTDFESIGKWYRQLMGESIGKEFTRDGTPVFTGITPTVSIGSTDLHSMAQLYLGGPYDKFTTFVRIDHPYTTVTLPDFPDYSPLVHNIQKSSLDRIMDAILKGVQSAYRKKNRPFMEVVLSDKSAETIGQFLQFKEMEMMFLGSLMNVNPFNQPNVEDYKVETKRILEESTK